MKNTPRDMILQFVREQRSLAVTMLFVLLLSNLLNVLLPLSIGLFYDAGLGGNSVKGALMGRLFPFIHGISGFFIFFGILVLLRSALFFVEKYRMGQLGELFSRQLRIRIFEHQMRMTYEAHRQRSTGKYLLRYSGDLNAIREFVNRGILVFTGDVFFLFGTFLALMLIHKMFGLMVFCIWVAMGLVVYLLSARLRNATVDRRGQRSKGLGFVSERLLAFYTIKSFRQEKRESRRYARESDRLFVYGLRYFRMSAMIQALFPLAFYGTLGLVLFLSLRYADSGNPGTLFAFVLLLLHMHTVLQRVLEVNLIWQSGFVSLGKLGALLTKPVEAESYTARLVKPVGRIEFDNVGFGYRHGRPIWQNLSVEIPANAITVIQGKHGSGKSTAFKLIQKIIEPLAGNIRIDGVDLASLSPREIRKHVSIASSETPLIGNTVMQAVAFSNTPENREKVLNLFAKLRFSLTENETETLDFRLEEQGRNLSSGEVAMLLLVRALLPEKKILLLDEPFALLDSAQAGRAARLLNRLKSNRTIVIIAKRIPPRLETDHIISFDQEHESEESANEPDTGNPDH